MFCYISILCCCFPLLAFVFFRPRLTGQLFRLWLGRGAGPCSWWLRLELYGSTTSTLSFFVEDFVRLPLMAMSALRGSELCTAKATCEWQLRILYLLHRAGDWQLRTKSGTQCRLPKPVQRRLLETTCDNYLFWFLIWWFCFSVLPILQQVPSNQFVSVRGIGNDLHFSHCHSAKSGGVLVFAACKC